MKNFNEWSKSIYWMDWIDYVEDKLTAYRKANGWRAWNDKRFTEAMQAVAKAEGIDWKDLWREYVID